MAQFRRPIDSFNYLQHLRSQNMTLFYRVLVDNPQASMPIVYTPTVGEACQTFSQLYHAPHGMFITPDMKFRIRKVLDNWPRPVDIIVVSDGSRILGLGDLGAGGMGIPMGKLDLYVACAGFRPENVLPILIDTGCGTSKVLSQPSYIGVQHERLADREYYQLLDEFVMAVKDKWPSCVLQFEDFSNNHCFDLLDKYRNQFRCFNDDIQGTGAVIAAGFLNAVKCSKKPLREHRIVFFGAGSAALGVADSILRIMEQEGVPREEGMKQLWLIDSKGVVTDTRTDITPQKRVMARRDNPPPLKTLDEAVKFVKPTVLIGLAGQGPVFTEEMVKIMLSATERPIIFPLSNPTSKAECSAEDAYRWTHDKAIFASGSPFDDVEFEDHLPGHVHHPGQGNNMYIFPGVGLGAWLAQSKVITDEMMAAAASSLAKMCTPEMIAQDTIYPGIHAVRDAAAHVATAVINKAHEQGVATAKKPADVMAHVRENMWFPNY